MDGIEGGYGAFILNEGDMFEGDGGSIKQDGEWLANILKKADNQCIPMCKDVGAQVFKRTFA